MISEKAKDKFCGQGLGGCDWFKVDSECAVSAAPAPPGSDFALSA